MNKNNKSNFYLGYVLEKRGINSDGLDSALVCLYQTIAYKDNDGNYYDFLLQEEMTGVNNKNCSSKESGSFYFAEKELYFKKDMKKEISIEEMKQLFSDILQFSKETAFINPEKITLIRD